MVRFTILLTASDLLRTACTTRRLGLALWRFRCLTEPVKGSDMGNSTSSTKVARASLLQIKPGPQWAHQVSDAFESAVEVNEIPGPVPWVSADHRTFGSGIAAGPYSMTSTVACAWGIQIEGSPGRSIPWQQTARLDGSDLGMPCICANAD